jgi:hypothetical protein
MTMINQSIKWLQKLIMNGLNHPTAIYRALFVSSYWNRLIKKVGLNLCSGFILLIFLSDQVSAQGQMPSEIDPSKHYLFYMHGGFIEKHGIVGTHPQHGTYEWAAIVDTFKAKGFVVISEARENSVQPGRYAKSVASAVDELLSKGVPPEKITISGHSKGALISWLTSGFVANPKVNYVIMASCPPEGTNFRRGFNRFLRQDASNVTGRILNLYDVSDVIGGSCAEVFERAGKVSSKELSFDTGKGHGLFYTPQDNWINAASNWAKGKNPN